MPKYIGNTSSAVLTLSQANGDTIFLLDDTIHTKPVDFHCETYKDQAYVGKKTFTSVYTADPPDNVFTFEFNSTFDVIACSLTDIAIIDPTYPLPAGKQISYIFYKDFATDATETEAAKAGGVVITFTPDQKIPKDDGFEVGVLSPFAKFVRNGEAERKCAVEPPVEDFSQYCDDAEYLCFDGTFEANQKYVVTCPDVKVELPYAKGTYTVAAGGYWNGQSNTYYQRDPKKIEFVNAASFTTILGSVILAASAIAALF